MQNSLINDLDQKPMNSFQWFLICMCILLNIIDGFDVMVMAFTSTAVSSEWGLSGAQLGSLLSAGLFGMAFGSLLIAPLADKIGRRPLVLLCLLICAISMLASAFSQQAIHLGIMRFITGLGIGGILASSSVIASEYSSAKLRNLCLGLQTTGYALGATLGGIISIYIISSMGWRSVFLFGGAITTVMLIVSYFTLPESIDYLLGKQPKNALTRVNVLLQKTAMQPISELPLLNTTHTLKKNSLAQLFSGSVGIRTLSLWLSFFLVMFGFYFVMSWTPKILTASGLSAEQGLTFGMLISAGGILGGLSLGLFSSKFKVFNVHSLYLLLATALITLFVFNISNLQIALIISIFLGIILNGCVAGLYTIAPTIYEAEYRATGVGYAIGVGRAGGILSPLVAGVFLDKGIAPLTLYSYYAIPFIIAIIFIVVISTSYAKNQQKLNLNNSLL